MTWRGVHDCVKRMGGRVNSQISLPLTQAPTKMHEASRAMTAADAARLTGKRPVRQSGFDGTAGVDEISGCANLGGTIRSTPTAVRSEGIAAGTQRNAEALSVAAAPLAPSAAATASAGIAPAGLPQPQSPLVSLLDGRGWTILRVTLDSLMLSAAVVLALWWPGEPSSASHGGAFLLLLPFVVLTLLTLRGAYERRLRAMPLAGGGPLVGAVSISVMALVVVDTYITREPVRPEVLVRVWALAITFAHGGRMVAFLWQHWARAHAVVARPTLIVGAGVVGAKIARRLLADSQYGLRPIGFVEGNPAPLGAGTNLPVLGRPDELEDIIRDTGAQHLVLAFSSSADRSFVPVLRRAKRAGVEVSLVPRMFESINDRVSYEALGGLPVLSIRGTDPLGWRFAIKHALDRVVAAIMLVALAPVMLAIAVAVRLSSPGPVVFSQPRVGRDGHGFKLLKFRSMRIPESPQGGGAFRAPEGCAPGGVEGVDRRTLIGCFLRRTSLDELPQLINVLKGEMSLVGPRPERAEYVAIFGSDIEGYGDRHRVKPGITGWAQVHGLRGQTSIADRAEWDNFYIENWSLKLDLRILAMTALAAVRTGEDG
jgi:exopolysaccharide biosynthesis polyprenyl glycosylphosphotransferase